MSTINEFAVTHLIADHQADLRAEAAADRLARQARIGAGPAAWRRGLHRMFGRTAQPRRSATWRPESAARC